MINDIDTIEKTDSKLKESAKKWWTAHSQDYLPEGEATHRGAKMGLNDIDFLAYLDKIDAQFKRQAYFAQKRGAPLFSSLMPIEMLAGKQVLEVGCGLGAHSECLARTGAKLTSIDLSPMSVAVTQRRLHLKNLSANVLNADAEHLPFEDNQFDFIWSWGVIHHSPNTLACANEITRVLKPGGKLAIMLYHRHSLYNWVNVILRYGILQGKLRHMSVQELHNAYTDGKYFGGAPLSKYYTKKQVRDVLFPNLSVTQQIAFEQKKAVSFIVPARYRTHFETSIPDHLFTYLFSHWGFLLLTYAEKPRS